MTLYCQTILYGFILIMPGRISNSPATSRDANEIHLDTTEIYFTEVMFPHSLLCTPRLKTRALQKQKNWQMTHPELYPEFQLIILNQKTEPAIESNHTNAIYRH